MSQSASRGARWEAAAQRAREAGIRAEHVAGPMWRVESASKPGTMYWVTVRDGRPVSCDCPGGYGESACQHKAAVSLRLVPEGQMRMGMEP